MRWMNVEKKKNECMWKDLPISNYQQSTQNKDTESRNYVHYTLIARQYIQLLSRDFNTQQKRLHDIRLDTNKITKLKDEQYIIHSNSRISPPTYNTGGGETKVKTLLCSL